MPGTTTDGPDQVAAASGGTTVSSSAEEVDLRHAFPAGAGGRGVEGVRHGRNPVQRRPRTEIGDTGNRDQSGDVGSPGRHQGREAAASRMADQQERPCPGLALQRVDRLVRGLDRLCGQSMRGPPAGIAAAAIVARDPLAGTGDIGHRRHLRPGPRAPGRLGGGGVGSRDGVARSIQATPSPSRNTARIGAPVGAARSRPWRTKRPAGNVRSDSPAVSARCRATPRSVASEPAQAESMAAIRVPVMISNFVNING